MDQAGLARLYQLDQILADLPRQYEGRDRIRADLHSVFRFVYTLQPKTETFSGAGRSATLFFLTGVLPVTFKGASYNIPVTIYFDPPYPKSAPRCFVTPTDNMAITANHPSVDQGGMYYSPMLSAWNERASNLTDLVSHMISSFSASPPVHATQSHPERRSQQSASQRPPVAGGEYFGRLDDVASANPVAQPVGAPFGAAERHVLIQRTTQALKDRWPVVIGKIVSEVNGQIDKRNELKTQVQQLQQDLADLKLRAREQETQVKEMETAEADLTAFIEANEGRDPEPEHLKKQLDPNSRLVLDMLAEELALDEFLAALDGLLAARRVSIDDFLREVRDTSRRKFMCCEQRKKAEAAVWAARGQAAMPA